MTSEEAKMYPENVYDERMSMKGDPYEMLQEENRRLAAKVEDYAEALYHLEGEYNNLCVDLEKMIQKHDCMAVEKCVRGERIEQLESAIKQILWKLNRKEMYRCDSQYNVVEVKEPCVWAKIDINDACLNEAKALIGGEAANISYRQQVRINSERME
jgi:DNA uptake protein ComE-like DNA-binding protein